MSFEPIPRPRRLIPSAAPYKAIGQLLLAPDDLTIAGGLPIYERGFGVKAAVSINDARTRPILCQREEIVQSILTLSARPQASYREIDRSSCNMEDLMIEIARDSIRRQQDVEIFKLLNAAVPADHYISCQGLLQPENLLLARAVIAEHELWPKYALMHEMRWKDILTWGDVPGLVVYPRDVYEADPFGIRGTFHGTQLLVSTMWPKNSVIVIAEPEYVGILATVERESIRRREVEVPAHARLIIGWDGVQPTTDTLVTDSTTEPGVEYLIKQQISIGVINDYTTARVYLG